MTTIDETERFSAALVTGGSRGLGRALGLTLARRGRPVVLVAREAGPLDQAVAEIRARGGRAYAIAADVGDKDAVASIAGRAAALVGGIDLLVNNASTLGPVPLRLLLDTDCEDLERALQVNLVGPFRLAKALAGPMVLLGLRDKGVRWASLTHAAGLSSTGDAALDAALPLPERFEIPAATVAAIADTRRGGGRVIAVGTTVVRALEGRVAAAPDGILRAGAGVTDLRIGPGHRRRVADGILSGIHTRAESHFALLAAFAPSELLEAAERAAEARDYTTHELGDAMLVLGSRVGTDATVVSGRANG